MYKACKEIGQKENSSPETDVNFASQHLHMAPSQNTRLLGDHKTNLAFALNMQFKDLGLFFPTWQKERVLGGLLAICHIGMYEGYLMRWNTLWCIAMFYMEIFPPNIRWCPLVPNLPSPMEGMVWQNAFEYALIFIFRSIIYLVVMCERCLLSDDGPADPPLCCVIVTVHTTKEQCWSYAMATAGSYV